MTEAPIIIDRQHFDLDAKPDNVEAAATAWANLGTAAEDTASRLDDAATASYDTWQGRTRDAYENHASRLRDSCVDMRAPADRIALALGNIAAALRTKQSELNDALTAARSGVDHTVSGDRYTFRPQTPEQTEQVMLGLYTSGAIRLSLNEILTAEGATVSEAVNAWQDVTFDWETVADGGVEDAFALPDEAPEGAVITLPDGTVVVDTGGDGDDEVEVTRDADGNVVVTVNGESTTYPPGTPVVLRTGAGDDSVESEVGAVVVTGDGDDTVASRGDDDNTVLTGAGNDESTVLGDGNNRISTGGGDDRVRFGEDGGVSVAGDNLVSTGGGEDDVWVNGDGDNVVSTGDAHDAVTGGEGVDHVYTGDGGDYVRGRDGRDVIVGGRGDDEIYGGGHGDHVYGGDGVDYVDAGKGADNVYGGDGQDVLYGMDGDDNVHGDNGSDYLEGAKGDDMLDGGNDDTAGDMGGDVLSGGRGDDRMFGRDGNDVGYGGHGTDYANGGGGNDHAYIQDGDTTTETSSERVDIVSHDFVQIDDDATESFRDRMEADLDMLSASPTGQQGIDHLRDHREGNRSPSEYELTITEYDEQNGSADTDRRGLFDKESTIQINPDFISDFGQGNENEPPVGLLYHELAHINSSWDGSFDSDPVPNGVDQGEKKAERQAVGLPTDGSEYDPDNPEANLDLDYELTENGLLDELGRPPRETYR